LSEFRIQNALLMPGIEIVKKAKPGPVTDPERA